MPGIVMVDLTGDYSLNVVDDALWDQIYEVDSEDMDRWSRIVEYLATSNAEDQAESRKADPTLPLPAGKVLHSCGMQANVFESMVYNFGLIRGAIVLRD